MKNGPKKMRMENERKKKEREKEREREKWETETAFHGKQFFLSSSFLPSLSLFFLSSFSSSSILGIESILEKEERWRKRERWWREGGVEFVIIIVMMMHFFFSLSFFLPFSLSFFLLSSSFNFFFLSFYEVLLMGMKMSSLPRKNMYVWKTWKRKERERERKRERNWVRKRNNWIMFFLNTFWIAFHFLRKKHFIISSLFLFFSLEKDRKIWRKEREKWKREREETDLNKKWKFIPIVLNHGIGTWTNLILTLFFLFFFSLSPSLSSLSLSLSMKTFKEKKEQRKKRNGRRIYTKECLIWWWNLSSLVNMLISFERIFSFFLALSFWLSD